MLPQGRGKTHLILERINARKDYRQVAVVVPTKRHIRGFLDSASRFFVIERLYSISGGEIYKFKNSEDENIIVLMVNGTYPETAGDIDYFIDCLFIDEGDSIDGRIIDMFPVFKDLYVTGTPKTAVPQQNSCMGYLYYSNLFDCKIFQLLDVEG